jgi:hypothetical protein
MGSGGTKIKAVALFVGLFVFYVLGVVVRQHYGIAVDVRNLSQHTLRNVSVKVEYRGKRYPLPDLQPGQHKRVFAQPAGESGINLEFVDWQNAKHVEDLAGYVEDGYSGTASGTVLADGRVVIDNDTFRHFYYKSWLDFVW